MADGKFRQDMPPPGGYQKFHYARTYLKSMYKPQIVLPIAAFCGIYGYYQGNMQIKQVQTEKFEDVDLKNAMEPFLFAERDRYWLKLLKRNRDYENDVMKNVPGWKTGTWYGEPVYFMIDDDKWWDPEFREVFAHAPNHKMSREKFWKNHSEYCAPKFYDKWIPEIIGRYIR